MRHRSKTAATTPLPSSIPAREQCCCCCCSSWYSRLSYRAIGLLRRLVARTISDCTTATARVYWSSSSCCCYYLHAELLLRLGEEGEEESAANYFDDLSTVTSLSLQQCRKRGRARASMSARSRRCSICCCCAVACAAAVDIREGALGPEASCYAGCSEHSQTHRCSC